MSRIPELLSALRTEILSAPVADLPSIIGQVEAVKAEAFARLVVQRPSGDAEITEGDGADNDQLVTVQEAAKILGQSVRWVRDHQAELPRVRMPGRSLRFSERRLATFIRRRSYA